MIENPTPERPLLVGLLIDVSGSMTSSIGNVSGQAENRLQSFPKIGTATVYDWRDVWSKFKGSE